MILENNFNFFCNTDVIFGNKCREKIFEILKKENWRNIGLVVDNNLMITSEIPIFIDKLNSNSNKMIVGKCLISEPTYDSLEEMRKSFNGQKLDCIVGLGGGSALDMAKAMAVLVNNAKPAIEYRGFDKMTEPVLPIVAVPTTAGTGSEITPNASFIDTKEKRKMGINGEAVRPSYALLDPELTITCPEKPTISSGIDSIVHAVEAFVAKKTNSIARLFAKQGFNLVSLNLPKVINEPKNIEYRSNVMLGAFFSGMALMHSGTGPAAAMSYPLGVHFGVPHGLGCGVFLPYVVKYNIQNGYYGYGDMLDCQPVVNIEDKAEMFLRQINTLWGNLSLPNSLKQFNFGTKDIRNFIGEALVLKGALEQNPVPFYEKEIEFVLKCLLND